MISTECILHKAKILDFIEQFGLKPNFSSFLRSSGLASWSKYADIDLENIVATCDKINKQNLQKSQNDQNGHSINWAKGEYKLFLWLSSFYSYNFNIKISQLKQANLKFLNQLFPKRSKQFMKYSLKNAFQSNKYKRKSWEFEEISILEKLVTQYKEQNKRIVWRNIAFNIFIQSKGIYFRTYGQCRQMWVNHLDKSISRDKWITQEDQLLLSLVQQNNRSWAKLASKFGGSRSVHMVKNRYYSLMRKKQALKLKETSNVQNTKSSDLNCSEKVVEQILLKDPFYLSLKMIQIAQDYTEPHLSQLNSIQESRISQNKSICYEQKSLPSNPIFEYLSMSSKEELADKLGCQHFELVQNLLLKTQDRQIDYNDNQ